MKNSSVYHSLDSKWRDIAIELDTPRGDINAWSKESILGLKNSTDILVCILEDWGLRKTDAATLNRFVEVLENCNLNDIASQLRNKFLIQHSEQYSKLLEHITYYIHELVTLTEVDSEFMNSLRQNGLFNETEINILVCTLFTNHLIIYYCDT